MQKEDWDIGPSNNLKDGVAAYDLPPDINNFITLNSFEAYKRSKTAQLTRTISNAVKAG